MLIVKVSPAKSLQMIGTINQEYLENNASEDGHNSKERNRKYHETIHKEKQLREFSCHFEQILAYANGQSNLNAQAIWPYHLTSFVMHKCHRNILEKMKKAGYEKHFHNPKGQRCV
jgi:hypothetical protein